MSPSNFCRYLVYLLSGSKGRLIFPQISFLFLSKEFQKQAYNWVIRFTLVIIINNVCVSKYAYVVVTTFKWDTATYICIFHLQVHDAAKINMKMIKHKQYNITHSKRFEN